MNLEPFFKGWAKPGPVPPGALDGKPAVEPGETLDAISGHFRLFQLEAGHRFSTDDVLTAWYGTSWCPSARTVLDLGSGGGFDCFLAARQVGDSGHVIGVDMTPAMVTKARTNAEKGGYRNVEFRLGEIENLPIADGTADVIISNCVINLSPNKSRVFAEAYRALKPGGRLAISDVVAFAELPEDVRRDMALYTGCMAGAALVSEVEAMLLSTGFEQVRVAPKGESKSFIRDWAAGVAITDYVVSATIEAVKPAT